MAFRWIIGGFCLISGAIFLGINSLLLFRGAYRFGHDEIDRVALGIAAAVVPWVIAVLPALVTETWKRTILGLRRPSATTLGVIVVWGCFIAYNLTGGAGVIALSRLETVADREKSADTSRALKDQRDALRKQLEGVPTHRPAATVRQLLVAEKQNRQWQRTDECKDATSKDGRAFCGALARLDGELKAAEAAEKLRQEIASLDGRMAEAKPVIASADPQADLIHDATGIAKSKIQLWIPAATPIVLEIGAGLMWHFGFSVLGIRLRERAPSPSPRAPAGGHLSVAALMSPERSDLLPLASQGSLEALTARRQLAEWFWRECSRRVPSGCMTEAQWYEHYCAVCSRSSDTPLPIETFRRMAERHVPRTGEVDGETYYYEILPVIPEGAR